MKYLLNYRDVLTLNDSIIELFTLIFQNIKLADSLIIKMCIFNSYIHATIHAQKCPTITRAVDHFDHLPLKQ